MIGNMIVHLYWVRRAVLRGDEEARWAALRAALVPFAVPASLAVAWTGLATVLVLGLHVGLLAYTAAMAAAGTVGLGLAVWREYARRSERYDLTVGMVHALASLVGTVRDGLRPRRARVGRAVP